MSLVGEDVETVQPRSRIADDFDAIRVSRALNTLLLNTWQYRVSTKVTRVSRNFNIDLTDLRIAIASVSTLVRRKVPNVAWVNVYGGGLVHENAHAVFFPSVKVNLVLSLLYKYCRSRGIEFDAKLLNRVENIVSDVINEAIVVLHRLPGYEKLLEFIWYYDLLQNPVPPPPQVESNPPRALLRLHRWRLAQLYTGRENSLRIDKPLLPSHHVYNALLEAVEEFSIEKHWSRVTDAGFAQTLRNLIDQGLFDSIDEFFATYLSWLSQPWAVDATTFYELLRASRGVDSLYRVYFTLVGGYYRILLLMKELLRELEQEMPNLDHSIPQDVPADILDDLADLLDAGEAPAVLLPPRVAEYVARRLVDAVLVARGAKAIHTQEAVSMLQKVPWYRRPRGRFDPQSLVKPITEWRVVVKTSVPVASRSRASVSALPDTITIVIDESGSTAKPCSVLSPVVGIETPVYDVERVTAMGLLYNVLDAGGEDVRVNLVRFSSTVRTETMNIRDAYEWFKKLSEDELEWGGTEIINAVKVALEVHRDGPLNYFILMTDMEISPAEADMVYQMVSRKLKRSPILVLAANAGVPSELQRLNSYSNAAAIGVKTVSDYSLLKQAVIKVAKLLQ